jgi:hypothetical protein
MVGGAKPLGDNVFAGHAAAGAAAISASAISVHPLDTVKTLLQTSTRPPLPFHCLQCGFFSRSDLGLFHVLVSCAAERVGEAGEDGTPTGAGPAHGHLRPCRFGRLPLFES